MKEYIIKVDEDKKDIMGNMPLMDKPKELVRCKDCKFGKVNPCAEYVTCFYEYSCLYGNTRKADWFCADGKRK